MLLSQSNFEVVSHMNLSYTVAAAKSRFQITKHVAPKKNKWK